VNGNERRFLAGMACIAGAMFGQAPAKRAFEVASIRPSPLIETIAQQIDQGKLHVGMFVEGTRVDIGFLSVGDMLPISYGVKPYQVAGPDSMRNDHWDILAKIPEGGSKDEVPGMLRSLLEERFKLKVHTESREVNVYALAVGKDGAKLKQAGTGAAFPTDAGKAILTGPQGQVQANADGKTMLIATPAGSLRVTTPNPQFDTTRVEIASIGMGGLADLLRPLTDKPVIDTTGLKGVYAVSLEMSSYDVKAVMREAMGLNGLTSALGSQSDPRGSRVFDAVEKLGLKLEARKMAVETIVVDHVEKSPTEN